MTEPERLADQMTRALEGNAWHGPSLREVLQGVAAAGAAERPIASAHNIWEIVNHVAAWHRVALRRLGGETYELSPAEDWPTVASSGDAAWLQACEEMMDSGHALAEAMRNCPHGLLEETAPGQSYTHAIMLHGVVQHDLYHAGQIVLLKKMI